MHMRTYKHIHAHEHTCTHTNTCIHTEIHTETYMHTYRWTYKNTHINTYTNTHVSFIHSSWNRHLGCSYFLATIINSLSEQSSEMYLWDTDVLSFRHMPRSGFAGPPHSSFWILRGTLVLFSMVSIAMYIPISIIQRSLVHTFQHLSP